MNFLDSRYRSFNFRVSLDSYYLNLVFDDLFLMCGDGTFLGKVSEDF